MSTTPQIVKTPVWVTMLTNSVSKYAYGIPVRVEKSQLVTNCRENENYPCRVKVNPSTFRICRVNAVASYTLHTQNSSPLVFLTFLLSPIPWEERGQKIGKYDTTVVL